MSTTSKSPKRVLEEALVVGRQVFPAYSHRFSPQKFTQPQLFASLVLKEFLRLDYRKLAALLADAADLAATIGLTKVPHFTTFQKAADRLLRAPHAKKLLACHGESSAATTTAGSHDRSGGRRRLGL